MTPLVCCSSEKSERGQGPQMITLEASPMAFGPSKSTPV